MRHTRGGFSRVELAALVVAMAVMYCMAAVGRNGQARGQAMLARCASNQKLLLSAVHQYAEGNAELLPNLQWSGRRDQSDEHASIPDLNRAQRRAGELFQQLTGRTDLVPRSDWIPQPRYTWMVSCAERGTAALEFTACPADADLLNLRRKYFDPNREDDELPNVFGTRGPVDRVLKAVASTYEPVPASWSQDRGGTDPRAPTPIVEQGQTDIEYRVPSEKPFGTRARRLSEVRFPSEKVYLHDSLDRHFGSMLRAYGDVEAEQPVGLFDGSVRRLATKEALAGGQPNSAAYDTVTRFRVVGSDPWNAREIAAKDQAGYYRWTRGGLGGQDFDGKERWLGTQAPSMPSTTFIIATP